ncbi:hypothetical protein EHE19_014460 [Ruminiclostridium herbifermentans]|uniref:Uncharacterized protein n=1 Tax=Ruminiclostridium herbifermentans TaxID=2488810 RepID=A0A4U7JLG0_9FIRM|nr:DUF6365 family protein [Ruminiclostridium herbifermentans]QNU66075.1 hypothetical protein EHE19_014460 [Ruminiclostridium herbifermentans]
MNVGIIVTSYWAYGELLIALQFAKRIKKFGYNPYFFIPPSHKNILQQENINYCVLIPNIGSINRILFQDYENRCHPEYVILSDFLNYNFCEKDYGLSVKDLEIFSGRIGTFDNFDWTIKLRKMDTYGFAASIASKVDINKYGFKLVPCPITNVNEQNEDDKFYYSLIDEYLEYDEEKKIKMREELNLPQKKPIILVTSATWQDTYKSYPQIIKCVEIFNNVYARLIDKMSEKVTIVHVGKNSSIKFKNENKNIIYLDNLSPKLFDKYCIACDVFLSRNITSTTLAKVACSGIPAMVLTNSLHIKNGVVLSSNSEITNEMKKELEKIDDLYPYRMFPVGWYSFLEPIHKNNPYFELVIEEEVFDFDKVLKSIDKMTNDAGYRAEIKEKAMQYRLTLENLKKPEEILSLLNNRD